jgi:hypothetical protein
MKTILVLIAFFTFVFSEQRTVQVHVGKNDVVVKSTWMWPTHCAYDTAFSVNVEDTMFFCWISSKTGYVDMSSVKETLVVKKDTTISH